jgi:F0F1-type ATP synthase gamma subunit
MWILDQSFSPFVIFQESYKDYLRQDEEVEQLMEQITKVVENNAEECTKLFHLFKDYSFLWEQDVNQTFSEFLHGNLSPNPLRASAQSHAGKLRRLASARSAVTSRYVKWADCKLCTVGLYVGI